MKSQSPEVKTVDGKDIERGVNDLLQEKFSCRTYGSAIRDCGFQEKLCRLVKQEDVVAKRKESNDAEPSTVATFRNESGELYAEDFDQHIEILTEVVIPAAEISLEESQVGDPGEPLLSDQEKLRLLAYANSHVLIDKGNAIPLTARGAVCDIDVRVANPVAQRVRLVAPNFHEKLANIIKGLLTAQIIRPSTSP